MSEEEDYFEACEELGQIVISQKSEFPPSYWVQFFCEHVREGDTPAMALALVKKELKNKE